MPSEFDLIRRLMARQSVQRKEIMLGIGDDAAVLNIPAGYELVVSTDTLNSGVHFPVATAAQDIGYKMLAVNLSDIAAMGAEPLAITLSLSLPEYCETWLNNLAEGFFQLAFEHNVQLIGGDTTCGPLSIGATIMGMAERGQSIRRNGANVSDLIYVTGTLGDAGAALLALQGELKLNASQQNALLRRLNRPVPRIDIGRQLRGFASACIDISDGLVADLGHILEQSHVGAILYVDQIPLSDELSTCFQQAGGWAIPLHSGDDYELCFTVPQERQTDFETSCLQQGLPVHCVGMTETAQGLKLIMPDGTIETAVMQGYDHFQR